MKPARLLLSAAVAALALLGFSSCLSDDEPAATPNYMIDMMTFLTTSETVSTFGYQRGADVPEVTLTANIGIKSELEAGTRVIAVFTAPGDTLPAHDEIIEFNQLALCYNSPLKQVNIADSTKWNANSLYLGALWRTGKHLNLVAAIQQEGKKQQLGLWVDSASLATGTAEVYLVNLTAPDPWLAAGDFYASFDIDALVSDPSISQINVNVNNSSNSNKKVFTFPLKR